MEAVESLLIADQCEILSRTGCRLRSFPRRDHPAYRLIVLTQPGPVAELPALVGNRVKLDTFATRLVALFSLVEGYVAAEPYRVDRRL